ncbi:hypothetical protein BB559_006620 [Furculomyces boomerangus]|uniref:Myb-like, SWIRM and MPN domain-containing protein 1 n=1 Tax=Furculomyces boomerangus TaxID=61424 RepID=A0A2T9Y1F8_9FUNG|nr:hypothetical protein BB559_006620 [Furculomyces boomerangus]
MTRAGRIKRSNKDKNLDEDLEIDIIGDKNSPKNQSSGKITDADNTEPETKNGKRKLSNTNKKKSKQQSSKSKPKPTKSISAQEEEELSTAYIAQLLAIEDGSANFDKFEHVGDEYMEGYYDEYGNKDNGEPSNSEDENYFMEDDDWSPAKTNKRRNSGTKSSGRARKNSRTDTNSKNKPSNKKFSGTKDIVQNQEQNENGFPNYEQKVDMNLSKAYIDINVDSSSPNENTQVTKPNQTNESISKLMDTKDTVYNVGVYTDEEESMFLEGLELYGRNWQKISGHMKTRESKSIRSHAQKHFIKLFRDNIPLPAKVAESGTGYTLSGKPLDPNSSTAKPYLTNFEILPNVLPAIDNINNNQDIGDGMNGQEHSSGDATQTPVVFSSINSNSNSLVQSYTRAPTSSPNTKRKPQKQKEEKSKPIIKKIVQTVPVVADNSTIYSGPTEYSLNRPKRSKNITTSSLAKYKSSDDPHALVKCMTFTGEPGSGVAGSQPFQIFVHSNAQVIMDLHAHLMETEIIGLLGGYWDSNNRILTVKQSFPCRAIATDDDHLNVEMDPTSEWLVRQEIAELDMRVVGWYHSHPTFLPDPSNIDIENQKAYQNLFMEDTSSNHNQPQSKDTEDNNVSDTNPKNDFKQENPSLGDNDNTPNSVIHEDGSNIDQKTNLGGDNLTKSLENDIIKEEESKNMENGDIVEQNQIALQNKDKDTKGKSMDAPFIGAIVGPYDPKLPRSYSVINWFMVSTETLLLGEQTPIPRKLETRVIDDKSIPSSLITKTQELLESYRDNSHRVRFLQVWRPNSMELKLTKCLLSLAYRMPWIDISPNEPDSKPHPLKNDTSGNQTTDLKLESIKNVDNSGTSGGSLLGIEQAGEVGDEQNEDIKVCSESNSEGSIDVLGTNGADSNLVGFDSSSDMSSVDIESIMNSGGEAVRNDKELDIEAGVPEPLPISVGVSDDTKRLPIWMQSEKLLLVVHNNLVKWI